MHAVLFASVGKGWTVSMGDLVPVADVRWVSHWGSDKPIVTFF